MNCQYCGTNGDHYCPNDVDTKETSTADDLCPHGQEWGECCDGLGVPMEVVNED